MKQILLTIILICFSITIILNDCKRLETDKKGKSNVIEVTIKETTPNKKNNQTIKINKQDNLINQANQKDQSNASIFDHNKNNQNKNKVLKPSTKIFDTPKSSQSIFNQNLNLNTNLKVGAELQKSQKSIEGILPTVPVVQSVIQMNSSPPIQMAQVLPLNPQHKVTSTPISKTSTIKQELLEYTLPALPIDVSHKIEYYYPYFYKTHVINYRDNIDIKQLSNTCADIGCDWCNLDNAKFCKQCRHGYFLYNNECFTVCPLNYVADIFKRSCHPLDITNTLTQVSYLKAFTVGSCKNICGKMSQDCSCLPTCISEGNCCSDYHLCENLINKNTLRKAECNAINPNCDLCEDFLTPRCGKCKEGLFNRNGDCIQSCFSDDKVMVINKVCIPNQNCLVENCAECVQGNSSVCRTCANGYYMYNNQCLKSCPFKMRADRIAWACLEPPVFAWYWIFPSKASCRQRCGRLIDTIEMDCSCHEDCFRFANCCQDVEDYCPQYSYWK